MSDHMTIWKFTIPITDDVTIEMPYNARILPHIAPGTDGRSLNMWAEVDPEALMNNRRFLVIETGNPIPPIPCHHVATTVAPPSVWHLYDAGNPLAPPIERGV